MKTQIEIKIYSDLSHVEINNLLNESINIFHKVVAKYSRFEDCSELSLLNKANGKIHQVDQEFFDLIKLCIELSNDTNGIFDITLIDLLEKYGYGKKLNFRKLDENEINTILATRPSWKDIELNENKKTIKLAKNQRIDLGGIAKGLAIKKVRDYLLDNKIMDFLINAGGDIYANGSKNEKNWIVSLFNTEQSIKNNKYSEFSKIELKNEAIASSGSWARKYRDFHHLINPKTGKPENSMNQTFIKGNNPILSDAFATITFIDPKIDKKILEKYKVEVMLIV